MNTHMINELNALYEDTCVKIYDPEYKQIIGVFPNFQKASHKLGVSPSSVQKRCASKTRIFSPVYNKDVACRLAKTTEKDKQLMIESLKPGFLKIQSHADTTS